MAYIYIHTRLPSLHASKLYYPPKPLIFSATTQNPKRFFFSTDNSSAKTQLFASSSSPTDASNTPGDSGTSNFCIILFRILIRCRCRKSITLLRRLRVQQRIKSMKNDSPNEENEMPDILSSIPFLPHVTPRTLKQLYLTSFSFISGIIVFGGLIAPILELKLGLGGTSYEDFIRKMHLPMQLSEVDPIVASFSGGAVGVISALMLLEINNVEQQEKKRCKYCHGTGYLACARCSASGLCLSIEPIVTGASNRPLNAPTTKRCLNCSGAGKVMCPTCLCTGKIMASEHDPRIEPLGVKDRPYLGRPNRIDLLGSVRPSWS